jgi:uncharacterized BrkB/YihY/UPF0761 family membrane protein
MIIGVNAQANSKSQFPSQKNVSGNNRSSVTTVYRREKKKHRNLKEIFILSLELTISMVLVGGALMVAISGMSGGPTMP